MINFQTPVTAGTVLVRSAVQSPNYVAGSSGWTINQDGTAEFSSGVFRGTVTGSTFQGTTFVINSAGAFFYNGTPGAGNLIASIAAAAGTDQYGNAYSGVFNAGNQQGAHFGVDANGTVYVVNSANQNVIMLNPGKQAMFVYSGTPAHGNLVVSIAAVAGTDSVGNSYPQGLNVTAGTISGATISASTILGNNSVQNASGEFFYSATPAAGNLILSIAAAAGTDAYGNHYLAGTTTYDNVKGTFAQFLGSALTLGAISGGVPDTADAGSVMVLTPSTAPGVIYVESGKDVAGGNTDNTVLAVKAGTPATATGAPFVPVVQLTDAAGTSAVDVWMSGSIEKTTNTGVPYTWQAPAYNANWAGSTTFNGSANWATMQYRLDPLDNLVIGGGFKAGSTLPTNPVFNAAAPYRPKGQWAIPALHNHAGTVTACWLTMTTGGNFDVITQTGGSIATGDEFLVPMTNVPLGNIS